MTKKQNLDEAYQKFLEKPEPVKTREEKQKESLAYKSMQNKSIK